MRTEPRRHTCLPDRSAQKHAWRQLRNVGGSASTGRWLIQRVVARTWNLSAIQDPDALDHLWEDLVSVVAARRPSHADERKLARAFMGHASDWWAEHRGSQAEWSFADTAKLGDQLRLGAVGQAQELACLRTDRRCAPRVQ